MPARSTLLVPLLAATACATPAASPGASASPEPAPVASASATTIDTTARAASPHTMRAIRVHAYGGPEVLVEERVPRPEPGPGELRVRVIAAGVNPLDAWVRQGSSRALPLVLGWDVAGVVDAVGAGVTRLAPGAHVFGMAALDRGGANAEYVVLREDEVAAKPRRLGFVEAAAVPLSALTAWQALHEVGRLEPGQVVLIQGGSGGVGSYAVQLAHLAGARVLATASTPNQDTLRALGADVPIDYTRERFEDVAREVDLVLDCVGGETMARSVAVVRRGGALVSLLGAPSPEVLAAAGIRGGHFVVRPDADALARLATLLDEGRLRVPEVAELPLSAVREAHARIATRHTRGKIVLRVAPDPR